MTVPTTEFLQTANLANAESHVFQVMILEPEMAEPDAEGLQHINLKTKQHFFELKKSMVSSKMASSYESELKTSFNIDAKETLVNVLRRELMTGLDKELLEKYTELGKKNYEKRKRLNLWQRWIHETFKIEELKYIENLKDLQAFIAIRTNVIAAGSRLGSAKFIVLPPEALMLLEGSTDFIYSGHSDSLPQQSTYKVGTYKRMAVFVDSSRIVGDYITLGRNQERGPGVYYVRKNANAAGELHPLAGPQEDIVEARTAGPDGTTDHIGLIVYYRIAEVGSMVESLFYSEKIKVGKKPFWKKILFL